jgi:hypothetical protein
LTYAPFPAAAFTSTTVSPPKPHNVGKSMSIFDSIVPPHVRRCLSSTAPYTRPLELVLELGCCLIISYSKDGACRIAGMCITSPESAFTNTRHKSPVPPRALTCPKLKSFRTASMWRMGYRECTKVWIADKGMIRHGNYNGGSEHGQVIVMQD